VQELAGEAQHASPAYVAFGLVGVVLMVATVVAIVMVRRRNSAKAQGFVEVDSTSPEERHVSGMQVTGYENPTYRHFEQV